MSGNIDLVINNTPEMDNKGHKAVLLINLGTPKSPKVKDVGGYLKQFLSDPRVIDINRFARWLLLNLIILPFRSRSSSKAYKSIWDKNGSPLLINSKQLTSDIAKKLGANYKVSLGMRYGQPSISSAIESLDIKSCSELIVLPLFPHYASASTGSAIEETFKVLSKYNVIPKTKILDDFFDKNFFIKSLSAKVSSYLKNINYDYLLMSYHGLPERQVLKSENTTRCNLIDPCPNINADNRYCYRAQCYETSRALGKALMLTPGQWSVAFQSRLGRTPWIKPYTDEELPKLINKGIKDLAICCPSFVADCLETLEEIGIRAREQWLSLGGRQLHLIPCLNADKNWVESLSSFLKQC